MATASTVVTSLILAHIGVHSESFGLSGLGVRREMEHGIIVGMDENPSGRLVLLRHGETEWALSGQHTGTTDVPLTAVGEQQAIASGQLLDSLELRMPLVISSPRQRAQRTAELAGLEVDRVWDALTEWNYGRFEGLTTPQIREEVPGWTVWTHPCPGGETLEEVGARADLVLSVVTPSLSERDVVLVGHGHFSRALVTRWVHMPTTEGRRFAMAPASYSVLGFEHTFQQVVKHNVHPSVRTGKK